MYNMNQEDLSRAMFMLTSWQNSPLLKSDSLLVTRQVTGEYQAKDPQMVAYLEFVRILKEAFVVFELVHVPREHNARADLLAKLASSGKAGKQRTAI